MQSLDLQRFTTQISAMGISRGKYGGNILSILWGIPTNKRMGEIWGIPDLLSNKIGDCISLLSMIHSIAHSGGIPDLLFKG